MPEVNAAVKISLQVTGAENTNALIRGFKGVGDSADAMQKRIGAAASKAAATAEQLAERQAAAELRGQRRRALQQTAASARADAAAEKSAQRQAAATERAATRQATAAERSATRRAASEARAATAAERAAERERRAAISVENEVEKLQRLEARREARAGARSQLGMDKPGGFLEGHGFQNRARAAIGAMRDISGAAWGVYGAYRLVSGAVGSVIDPMKEFETAVTSMRIKGGFSAAQTAALSQQFLTNARTGSAFTPTQQANAATELAAAGVQSSQLGAALPSTLKFGQANSLETGQAAGILVETGAQFGLGADQFERIGNTITKAANISTISVGDMAESLKYVGPVAKAAGLDLDFTAATIAKLGEGGIKGSMGGTALRTVITSLVHPAKSAKAAMSELGISKGDLQKGLSDLPGFLENLDKKMVAKGMGNAKRLEMEKLLFGAEGFNAVEVLMAALKDKGAQGWAGYVQTVRGATNEMDQASALIGDTYEGRIAKFNAQMDALKIKTGNALAPLITAALPGVAGAVQTVVDNPGDTALGIALGGSLAGMGVKALAASAGTSVSGVFMAALASGIAGYGLTTALLSALEIDPAKAGKAIFDLIHGTGVDENNNRSLSTGDAIRQNAIKTGRGYLPPGAGPLNKEGRMAAGAVEENLNNQDSRFFGQLEVIITDPSGRARPGNIASPGPLAIGIRSRN